MTSMSEAFASARRNTRAEKRKIQPKPKPGAITAAEMVELMAEAEELDFALATKHVNRERECDYIAKGPRPTRVTPISTKRPQPFSQAGADPDWRARPAAKTAPPTVDLAKCRLSERSAILNIALQEYRRFPVRELVDGDISRIGPEFGFILVQ